jgi:hypothetical protein
MPAKRYTLPTGQEIDVEVVEITKRDDPPTVLELADGSRIRLRIDVLEVGRAQGLWDADGNPVYHVKSANTMAVLDASEALRRPPAGADNGQS